MVIQRNRYSACFNVTTVQGNCHHYRTFAVFSFLKTSWFFVLEISAYISSVVRISLCPITDRMTFTLVSFSQSRLAFRGCRTARNVREPARFAVLQEYRRQQSEQYCQNNTDQDETDSCLIFQQTVLYFASFSYGFGISLTSFRKRLRISLRSAAEKYPMEFLPRYPITVRMPVQDSFTIFPVICSGTSANMRVAGPERRISFSI